MRVFAQYNESEEFAYREYTILQFGNSWDKIAGAILLNPGSAKPNDKIPEDDIKIGYQTIYNNADFRLLKEFHPDTTMRQLEKFFNGKFLPENLNLSKELNGTIVLHNLFNLREQDSEVAKLHASTNNLVITDKNTIKASLKGLKVLLGWGKLAKNDAGLIYRAKELFEIIEPAKRVYLNCSKSDIFEDSAFYHPGYLSRIYKKQEVQELARLLL